VIAALGRLEKPSHGWGHGLLVLGVSVAAFFFLGLLGSTATSITVLIGVILVHELGHYAGMRVFGYRNVRMFFIPLFGAAVSGRNVTAPGWQKAVVSLLGPVPGVLIGFVLLWVYFREPSRMLGQAALFFVFVNAFNLLPLLPLDGGHFLDHILFCRSRYLEAAFRALAGAGLALVGYVALDSYVLAFLGVIVATSARRAFRLATAAKEVAAEMPSDGGTAAESPPLEMVETIIRKARRWLFPERSPRNIAMQVREVWERVNARPPGAVATVALLALYAASVLSVAVVPIALGFATAEQKIVAYQRPDGATGRKEVHSFLGRLNAEIEVDENGLYHGRAVFYRLATDDMEREGSWAEGLWDGEWRSYDADGAAVSTTVFDKGEFVGYRERTESGRTEKKLEEMPGQFRRALAEHNAKAPHGPPADLWDVDRRPGVLNSSQDR
jgi:Zn-dependent protease